MKYLVLAAAAAVGLGSAAIAGDASGPSILTDAQMDVVVAGDRGAWVGGPNAPRGQNEIDNYGQVEDYDDASSRNNRSQGASVNLGG